MRRVTGATAAAAAAKKKNGSTPWWSGSGDDDDDDDDDDGTSGGGGVVISDIDVRVEAMRADYEGTVRALAKAGRRISKEAELVCLITLTHGLKGGDDWFQIVDRILTKWFLFFNFAARPF